MQNDDNQPGKELRPLQNNLPAAGCGIVSGLLYRLGWRLWRIIRP